MTPQHHSDANGFDHAATSLDFDQVLGWIASRCQNETAAADTRALVPVTDPAEIARRIALVEEMRHVEEMDGGVTPADTSYQRAIPAFLERRASLSGEDFLRIARGERACATMKRRLQGSKARCPGLAEMAAACVPQTGLAEAIERALDDEGNLRDDASPALKKLRAAMHRARESLRASSEKLTARYGEGAFATMMGRRYVLLVPRGRYEKTAGIVHGASQKGASVYLEPFQLVGKNNDLESVSNDAAAEEARIMEELSAGVRGAADAIAANVAFADRVDGLRARAIFGRVFDCNTPVASDGDVRLGHARHPLLALSLRDAGRDGELVPLDIALEPAERVMVITGPNAGGKTVALKTVGLAVLLFQTGLQVPCDEGSRLPVFERLFVDIGDEQSIASSLSTFTSHLRHLDRMCRRADSRTLCLIDEIGDGTDPDEGAAMAVASLERLLESGAAVIATTHYGRIKTFALQTDGVANASMAFDDTGGMPLYKLMQGIAGRSRGIETAERTGFDPAVVDRAKRFLGADAFRLEEILSDLEASHAAIERERDDLARQAASTQSLMAEYQRRVDALNLSKSEANKEAVREAEELLRRTRAEVERAVREIRERQASRDAIRSAHERLEKVAGEVEKAAAVPPPSPPAEPAETVAPGDRVRLSPTGSGPVGVVESVENGRATVAIDNKRIKLNVKGLYRAQEEEASPPRTVTHEAHIEPLASTSLDVRGFEREEAMSAVNQFIDSAVYSGVREIKIIHGIGEGILSRAVRELLQDDHRVASMRHGEQHEGGVGVTFVSLD